ncbi:hypothetical protein [Amycolatopsis sp. NPDC059657]|uniref:YxiG-like protein n=1 Tax=Amycolatopsis sp. NPDC059657 TaxID=3346899 RepID=UPI003671C716
MNAEQITAAFEDIFDQALVFHGYTDYMRDYDVIVYAKSGTESEHLRYRFKYCVRAEVASAVSSDIWRRSTDERLVDGWQELDLDGYVWGVRWQVLYPGAKLVSKSERAEAWSRRTGLPFHEALIEANGHTIALVFSDLVVEHIEPGYAPFTVD